MFSSLYTRPTTETQFFDHLMRRIEHDRDFFDRAETLLQTTATSEPLVAEALRTPQDIRYHAEGPFVRDHLRLMLMSLYAVAEGHVHLLEIEELARMKGYEQEIEELEYALREHVAWFEVYVLLHDVAKWHALTFRAPEHSRGAALGFNVNLTDQSEMDVVTRSAMREQYLDLFRDFASQHQGESARSVQSFFYLTYEIDCTYPHHDRMIHLPVYTHLLQRCALAYQLTDVHTSILQDVISSHLLFIPFKKTPFGTMDPFLHLARVRGYDTDAFIDFLLGALFLDFVCGSIRLSAHGYWHEIGLLVHALRAEHEADPSRRVEKFAVKQAQEHRLRLRLFQEVGLDGLSLMELLRAEPGPAFGKTLRRVQSAVVGEGDMPSLGEKIDAEISKRALAYYKKTFKPGL